AALEMVLARADRGAFESARLLSKSWPDVQLDCRFMFMGAATFARLHEYGHLLMGHLEKPQRHALEYEADAFAYKVLTEASRGISGGYFGSFPVKVGAISLLVMLLLIEAIEKHLPSPTHPSAAHRIMALLQDESRESATLLFYVEAILAICKTTIESHYG